MRSRGGQQRRPQLLHEVRAVADDGGGIVGAAGRPGAGHGPRRVVVLLEGAVHGQERGQLEVVELGLPHEQRRAHERRRHGRHQALPRVGVIVVVAATIAITTIAITTTTTTTTTQQ